MVSTLRTPYSLNHPLLNSTDVYFQNAPVLQRAPPTPPPEAATATSWPPPRPQPMPPQAQKSTFDGCKSATARTSLGVLVFSGHAAAALLGGNRSVRCRSLGVGLRRRCSLHVQGRHRGRYSLPPAAPRRLRAVCSGSLLSRVRANCRSVASGRVLLVAGALLILLITLATACNSSPCSCTVLHRRVIAMRPNA